MAEWQRKANERQPPSPSHMPTPAASRAARPRPGKRLPRPEDQNVRRRGSGGGCGLRPRWRTCAMISERVKDRQERVKDKAVECQVKAVKCQRKGSDDERFKHSAEICGEQSKREHSEKRHDTRTRVSKSKPTHQSSCRAVHDMAAISAPLIEECELLHQLVRRGRQEVLELSPVRATGRPARAAPQAKASVFGRTAAEAQRKTASPSLTHYHGITPRRGNVVWWEWPPHRSRAAAASTTTLTTSGGLARPASSQIAHTLTAAPQAKVSVFGRMAAEAQ